MVGGGGRLCPPHKLAPTKTFYIPAALGENRLQYLDKNRHELALTRLPSSCNAMCWNDSSIDSALPYILRKWVREDLHFTSELQNTYRKSHWIYFLIIPRHLPIDLPTYYVFSIHRTHQTVMISSRIPLCWSPHWNRPNDFIYRHLVFTFSIFTGLTEAFM